MAPGSCVGGHPPAGFQVSRSRYTKVVEILLQHLWAPWRMPYVAAARKDEECIFCQMAADAPRRDQENHILLRGPTAFVVLNLYPYNNGHLMVLPYHHVGSLEDLTPETQCEMMRMVSHFMKLMRTSMNPAGFNVGVNIGRAAGAGIDDHVHIHLVPRWQGDTNFMPVVARTRVIPEWLDDTYARLKSLLEEFPLVL